MAFSKSNGVDYYNIAKASGVVSDTGTLSVAQELCLKNGIKIPGLTVKVDTSLGDGLPQFNASNLFSNLQGPAKSWRIFWGDGSSDTIVNTITVPTHTYSSGGQYDISVVGNPNAQYRWGQSTDGDKVISIELWGKNFQLGGFQSATSLVSDNAPDIPNITTATTLFNGCTSLTTIGDWSSIVWQAATQDLYFVFTSCTVFNFDISNWQVGNATNFQNMFRNTQAFNQDIGGWDMSSAENIGQMFRDATAYNNGGVGGVGLGIDSWQLSGLTSTNLLFEGATAFDQTVDSWDMSLVNNMSAMFQNASSFNQDLNSWDLSPDLATGTATSVVTNKLVDSTADFVSAGVSNSTSKILNVTTGDFADITSHTATELTLDADIFTATGQSYRVFNNLSMSTMFSNASAFDGDISNWNTIGATSLQAMFSNATSFNQDIGSWDTRRNTSLNSTFIQASSFNQNIGAWETGEVTSMYYGFRTAVAFNNGGSDAIRNWDVSKVATMRSCFFNCINFNQPLDGWRPSSCTEFGEMFRNASAFDGDCTGWTLSTSTSDNINFGTAFLDASSFTGTGLGTWNTERVTSFSQAFQNTALNFPITHPNYWEMSPGVNMFYVFRLTPLNGGLASGVAGRNFEMRFSTSPSDSYNLNNMFAYCSDFNQDISTDATNNYWDVSRVTNMSAMFRFCSTFDQDISNWDTSACVDMSTMFNGCTVFDQPIGSWGANTSLVENMANMFKSTSFDQDISGWSIASLSNAAAFMNSNLAWSTANYDLLLDINTGWPSQAVIQSGVSIDFSATLHTTGGDAEAGKNYLTGTKGWTIVDGNP